MERPDFAALEQRLVTELGPALADALARITPDDPLAGCVIEGSPYHGRYSLHLDVRSNQLALLRGEQAQRLGRRAWTRDADDWRSTAKLAELDGLAPFSSEVADYALPAIAELRHDVRAFARAATYEDGWLEGHARPMLFRVCDRLVDGGAFAGVPCAVPAVVGFTLGEPRVTVARLLLPG